MRVALIGKMMSGKTTAAHYLTYERGVTRLAFADPVKTVTAHMLNTFDDTLRHMYGVDLQNPTYSAALVNQAKTHPTMRKMLQFVGTELGREYLGHEDLWVDVMAQQIENRYRKSDLVVDDCRFPNEALALRRLGFTFIRITRPEEDRLRMIHENYENPQAILSHPSETSLDDFVADSTIYATSVEELRTKVFNELGLSYD